MSSSPTISFCIGVPGSMQSINFILFGVVMERNAWASWGRVLLPPYRSNSLFSVNYAAK